MSIHWLSKDREALEESVDVLRQSLAGARNHFSFDPLQEVSGDGLLASFPRFGQCSDQIVQRFKTERTHQEP